MVPELIHVHRGAPRSGVGGMGGMEGDVPVGRARRHRAVDSEEARVAMAEAAAVSVA